jgi:hypothetical protein
MPLLERDLAAPVARHFKALGYRVFAEVDIAGRFADLVAMKPEDVVAVELKLAAWRRALRQATAYQLGADRSYVALPLDAARRAHRNRDAFEREGIGLLAVDDAGGVRTVLRASASPRGWPPFTDALRTRIQEPLGA